MNNRHPTEPERWVDEYGDDLYRYALFRLRDPVIAEDIVQETFLAALRAREDFAGQASERTWLTAILKHKIVDHIRKLSRERSLGDPDFASETTQGLFVEGGKWREEPVDWGDTPDQALEKKELRDVLRRCIAELPDRLGHAFSLRELDGLSSSEVCKVLNVTATNLWVMLYRARQQLRRCLELKWFGSTIAEKQK